MGQEKFVCLCPQKALEFGDDGELHAKDPNTQLREILDAIPYDNKETFIMQGGGMCIDRSLKGEHVAVAVEGPIITLFIGYLNNTPYLVQKYAHDEYEAFMSSMPADFESKNGSNPADKEWVVKKADKEAHIICKMYSQLGPALLPKLKGNYTVVCFDSKMIRVLAARSINGSDVHLWKGRGSNGEMVVASLQDLPFMKLSEDMIEIPAGHFVFGRRMAPTLFARTEEDLKKKGTEAAEAAKRALEGVSWVLHGPHVNHTGSEGPTMLSAAAMPFYPPALRKGATPGKASSNAGSRRTSRDFDDHRTTRRTSGDFGGGERPARRSMDMQPDRSGRRSCDVERSGRRSSDFGGGNERASQGRRSLDITSSGSARPHGVPAGNPEGASHRADQSNWWRKGPVKTGDTAEARGPSDPHWEERSTSPTGPLPVHPEEDERDLLDPDMQHKAAAVLLESLTAQPQQQGDPDLHEDRQGGDGQIPEALLEVLGGKFAKDPATVRMMRELLRHGPCGLVVTDATKEEMPIIFCNAVFEADTGYKAKEILGQNCRFLQSPPGAKMGKNPTTHAMRQAILTGSECHFRVLNYKKDSTPMWNDLAIAPLRDSKGIIRYHVGIQNFTPADPKELENLRRTASMSELDLTQLKQGVGILYTQPSM
uniref:Putative LOV domain-containing protein n=1 Tax=Nephroselmis olivacea TaxID=31312 RepID=A0A126WZD4_NEPOL|nr:putative LOV domain-containing protein [Nephroselmis olivacea]